MKYTKSTNDNGIVSIFCEKEDGKIWIIPEDAANSDYQAYLASLDTPQA
jgi:hypothetical protein